MNRQRLYDLQHILDNVETDIAVFPGGWFCAYESPAKFYESVETHTRSKDRIVTLGIDGIPQKPWPKEQTAIAVADRIIAIGRKFAPGEKIIAATGYDAKEQGISRMFNSGRERSYLGVCYDSFGIRQQDLPNPGVDIFLNHIHGFFTAGSGNSGEGYFAKHGLAGASKQWGIPAFGAAVFFDRRIPPKWPTGVQWTVGSRSTVCWNYDANPLRPQRKSLNIKEGITQIDTYNI